MAPWNHADMLPVPGSRPAAEGNSSVQYQFWASSMFAGLMGLHDRSGVSLAAFRCTGGLLSILSGGTGHWNTFWWPKHFGEWPLVSGRGGRVGLTGVAVAEDELGECGSGGGGHVTWMPLRVRWLNKGRALKLAGLGVHSFVHC